MRCKEIQLLPANKAWGSSRGNERLKQILGKLHLIFSPSVSIYCRQIHQDVFSSPMDNHEDCTSGWEWCQKHCIEALQVRDCPENHTIANKATVGTKRAVTGMSPGAFCTHPSAWQAVRNSVLKSQSFTYNYHCPFSHVISQKSVVANIPQVSEGRGECFVSLTS